MPLHDADAVRHALGRRDPGARLRVRAWLAQALLGSRALPLVVPAVAVLARRPLPAAEAVVNTVAAQLAARYDELDLAAFGVAEQPACVLLTPRFGTLAPRRRARPGHGDRAPGARGQAAAPGRRRRRADAARPRA